MQHFNFKIITLFYKKISFFISFYRQTNRQVFWYKKIYGLFSCNCYAVDYNSLHLFNWTLWQLKYLDLRLLSTRELETLYFDWLVSYNLYYERKWKIIFLCLEIEYILICFNFFCYFWGFFGSDLLFRFWLVLWPVETCYYVNLSTFPFIVIKKSSNYYLIPLFEFYFFYFLSFCFRSLIKFPFIFLFNIVMYYIFFLCYNNNYLIPVIKFFKFLIVSDSSYSYYYDADGPHYFLNSNLIPFELLYLDKLNYLLSKYQLLIFMFFIIWFNSFLFIFVVVCFLGSFFSIFKSILFFLLAILFFLYLFFWIFWFADFRKIRSYFFISILFLKFFIYCALFLLQIIKCLIVLNSTIILNNFLFFGGLFPFYYQSFSFMLYFYYFLLFFICFLYFISKIRYKFFPLITEKVMPFSIFRKWFWALRDKSHVMYFFWTFQDIPLYANILAFFFIIF